MTRLPQRDTRQAVPVDVENIHVSFGQQTVVDDLSFHVEAGETFVIMGPSGAGKSVLLRNIIGLHRPERGRVLIGGDDARDPATHRKHVTALVFQAGALFNSMTVYDNLALYPREHRLFTAAELDTKVRRTLDILALSGAASKMPAELSGGMRKRVAIARGLMMEPQLLLYDEPTSELDPITAANITEVIGTLREEFHVTSIVVSHDTRLALSIAQRVALMIDGRFVAVDEPERLRNSDDPVVQDFLNPTINIQQPRFRTKDSL